MTDEKVYTYWTKKEKQQEINEHYKDMKEHGFTKTDCKRDIELVMRDNNIKIRG